MLMTAFSARTIKTLSAISYIVIWNGKTFIFFLPGEGEGEGEGEGAGAGAGAGRSECLRI